MQFFLRVRLFILVGLVGVVESFEYRGFLEVCNHLYLVLCWNHLHQVSSSCLDFCQSCSTNLSSLLKCIILHTIIKKFLKPESTSFVLGLVFGLSVGLVVGLVTCSYALVVVFLSASTGSHNSDSSFLTSQHPSPFTQ